MSIPKPKPWIAGIEAYVPGKASTRSGRQPIKLSANESPLGPSPKAIAAMADIQGQAHRYPDPASTKLRHKIAERHGLDPERVVCGTGSDELLHLLAGGYATVGDEILYVRHGFSVYPIASHRVGATPIAAPDRNYRCDVDAVLQSVTPRTRVVFLANPNNPTGTYIDEGDVRRLHAGLRTDIVLVLDAAYAEYIDTPDYMCGLKLAKTESNVVTTRTFSKIYGLAAERVGWAYGPLPIIDILNRTRAPFNVCSTGQVGALAALDDQDWIARAKAHNDIWLKWLTAEINGLGNYGLAVVPSVCNFILVRFPQLGDCTAEAANTWLLEHDYIVRWLPGQGLGDCLRITVGTEDQCTGLVASLRMFLAQAKQ